MTTEELEQEMKALENRLRRVKALSRDLEQIQEMAVADDVCDAGCGRYFYIRTLEDNDHEMIIVNMKMKLMELLQVLKNKREAQLKELLG